MYTFERDVCHRTGQVALNRLHYINILRTNHHVHRLVCGKAGIQAGEPTAKEFHQIVLNHHAVQDVTLTDEIRHKRIFWLIIHILRGANLLNFAIIHHHDGVGHGQRLFLVVGNVNETDPQTLLNIFEFGLHIFAQFQIQRRQRFIQQKHTRIVRQSARDGHPLLLPTGQGGYLPFIKPNQIHQFKHIRNRFLDFGVALFLHTHTESDIFIYIQMRKQGITLENRIHRPLVRRQVVHTFAIKKNIAGIRSDKAADNPQGGCFAAAGRPQQRNKLPIGNA